MTSIAVGDTFPPIPPTPLLEFLVLLADEPAATPKETSTRGTMVVSPITVGCPTTVLVETTFSMPLSSDEITSLKLLSLSAIQTASCLIICIQNKNTKNFELCKE
jgi:hypothetical protein